MPEAKGVLVVTELADGRLDVISRELLTIGRQLAGKAGEELSAVVAGEGVEGAAREAIACGADKAYLAQHPLLKGFQIEAHLAALQQVVTTASPSIILVGRTLIGRDLGPRLAFRLGVGLAQDCVQLSFDAATRALEAHRPVYGGASMAKVSLTAKPYIATVRSKIFEAASPDPNRKGQVVPVSVTLEPKVVATRVVNRVKEEVKGVRLEDARVVVSGGRGLGGPEPFKTLEELAKLLGGAVGASRPVCDAGWLPSSQQVGLTGKTVSPDLYIAVAISGASQHMAGCSGAKVIVSINKDAEASIFKESRYGVVGDWKKVLPGFIQAVRELAKG
ncbi:MAG: electron transfer flavoprotein subunit alpha/FixB family protein [Chloroflexi bacterium]|nr:electron transfer flavoprotein subunit alpha/FixB family protein [Chloroflexota bacterium]